MEEKNIPKNRQWLEITVQEHEELIADSEELRKIKQLIKLTGLEQVLNTVEYLLQFETKLEELEPEEKEKTRVV